MHSAWRIVKASHAARAFTGDGAWHTGGRWNSPGVSLVYTSEHKSLAVLEILVHLDPQDALHHVTFQIEFDEALVERLPREHLPAGWREEMPARAARDLGNTWVREKRSAVLAVPSVIIPEELNFLLNPAHPDFKKIRVGKPQPFTFDPRLVTG